METLRWIPGGDYPWGGGLSKRVLSYRVFEGRLTQEERYSEEREEGWFGGSSEPFNNQQAPSGEH